MTETFEQRFIRQMASAFGLTGDDVRRDYAMTVAIQNVKYIVGYDPQKLLPDDRGSVRHRAYAWRQIDVARWNDADSSPLEDIARWRASIFEHPEVRRSIAEAAFAAYINVDMDNEFIDLTGSPTGRHVDFRKLYPKREPTYEHKVAVITAGTDFAALERRILASIDDTRVRGIIIDFDGPFGEVYNPGVPLRDPPFVFEKPKAVATSAGKRDMSYLKHDTDKSIKRKKRRDARKTKVVRR